MSPLPARGPALERWWEREIDRRVASAVGLADDLSDRALALHFRPLAGLPAEGSIDPMLWARFLYGIELARTGPVGPRGDVAELANDVVEWAIARYDDPDQDRFGFDAWEQELNHPAPNADEALREFVIDEVAPRLERAGLYALL